MSRQFDFTKMPTHEVLAVFRSMSDEELDALFPSLCPEHQRLSVEITFERFAT